MGTKTQKQRKCCYHNLNAKQLSRNSQNRCKDSGFVFSTLIALDLSSSLAAFAEKLQPDRHWVVSL